MTDRRTRWPDTVLAALLAVTLLLTLVNTLLLAGAGLPTVHHGRQQDGSGAGFELPAGVPAVYGEELGISFDQVSSETPQEAEKVLRTLAELDKINLSSEEHSRYVDILYEMNGGISCEYCCEARSVITKNGEPGCGCAHAVAMRGLTKYLLKHHGDEMTDNEIFQEVAKWKTRFFPTQTKSKATGLQEKDVTTTFVNLASNEYRGVSSDKGGWVGDC